MPQALQGLPCAGVVLLIRILPGDEAFIINVLSLKCDLIHNATNKIIKTSNVTQY